MVKMTKAMEMIKMNNFEKEIKKENKKERKLAKKYFEILKFEKKESPTGYYLGFNSLDVSGFLKPLDRRPNYAKNDKTSFKLDALSKFPELSKIIENNIENNKADTLIFLDNSLFAGPNLENADIKPSSYTGTKNFGFDFKTNKFEAMNLAFFKNGISTRLNKDTNLIFISKSPQVIRNFFVVENSKIKITEFYYCEKFSSVSNRFLIKNSNIEHILVSRSTSNSFVLESFKSDSSQVVQRSFINSKKGFDLKGFSFQASESSIKQRGSVLNSGSQLWFFNAGDVGVHSKIDISLRGVFSNSSTFFESLIEIKKNAKNSSANLDIKGLREKGGKVFCVPSLEINNKNCTAKHSFAVSKLEKEKEDYLRSKGIDPKNVKKIARENMLKWWRD